MSEELRKKAALLFFSSWMWICITAVPMNYYGAYGRPVDYAAAIFSAVFAMGFACITVLILFSEWVK